MGGVRWKTDLSAEMFQKTTCFFSLVMHIAFHGNSPGRGVVGLTLDESSKRQQNMCQVFIQNLGNVKCEWCISLSNLNKIYYEIQSHA